MEEIEHLPPLGDGDHALLQVKVSFEVVSHVMKRLNFRKANFDAMRSFLRGTIIPAELDVNEKWLFLKSKITEAVKKFIPELNIKSNKNRRYTANRDILEQVRKKKRLRETTEGSSQWHILNLAEWYKRDTSRISIRFSVVHDLHKFYAGSCGVRTLPVCR